MTFQELLDELAEAARSNRDKGTQFEKLIANYLLTDPQYADRLEAVFRVKKLLQVAKKLGKPLEPATFTKEVLAQMVLDLLNKNVCHGQVFRRLQTEELRAIPLPYRSTVAHWQNGMELLDMVASERVLKEQARYIWQKHQIDIAAPPPAAFGAERSKASLVVLKGQAVTRFESSRDLLIFLRPPE